jgi:hypothetical protein
MSELVALRICGHEIEERLHLARAKEFARYLVCDLSKRGDVE